MRSDRAAKSNQSLSCRLMGEPLLLSTTLLIRWNKCSRNERDECAQVCGSQPAITITVRNPVAIIFSIETIASRKLKAGPDRTEASWPEEELRGRRREGKDGI